MRVALNLAKHHSGLTYPNPSVGAVIARGGVTLSNGVTSAGGRPHAERTAILEAKMLGHNLRGATIYVTLEPCNHFGKSSPCTNDIIASGISNVYIGITDPDSRINGAGVLALRQAGITVSVGILDREIAQFYRPYIVSKTQNRSFVTAKIACSLDGKVATRIGQSQSSERWISSPKTREYTNFLRSKYDGIMVGGETFRQDAPHLNVRTLGLSDFSPERFVFSRTICQGDLPDGFKVANGEPLEVLRNLYQNHQICHLLLEGGPSLITSFLQAKLVDELCIVYAPILLGSEGKNCINALPIDELTQAPQLELTSTDIIDGDVIAFYCVNNTSAN